MYKTFLKWVWAQVYRETYISEKKNAIFLLWIFSSSSERLFPLGWARFSNWFFSLWVMDYESWILKILKTLLRSLDQTSQISHYPPTIYFGQSMNVKSPWLIILVATRNVLWHINSISSFSWNKNLEKTIIEFRINSTQINYTQTIINESNQLWIHSEWYWSRLSFCVGETVGGTSREVLRLLSIDFLVN